MVKTGVLKGPQNRPLTTGTDVAVGTALDDTLNGVVSTAETTLNVSDSIDGGAGTDTLSVVVGASAGAVALNGATITGVENFIVRNVSGQTVSQDFALITGETGFTSNVSTSAVTVTNLAAGTTATIVGNGAATNANTNIGYIATTATAGALVINSGVTAGDVTISGSALASQSVSSTGATNVIGVLELAATTTTLTIDAATKLTTGEIKNTTAAALTKVTITGAGAVDIDAAALPTTTRTVDASAATGAVSVKAGAVTEATNPSTVDIADVTISTGSGNDLVDVASVVTARELSVSTGAGDDTIVIGTELVDSGTLIAGDVIAGGEGIDTLSMTTAVVAAQITQGAVTTVSGIEKITVSDALTAELTTGTFQAGITSVNLSAGANAGTIVFGAGANVVNLAGALAGTLTINDTGSATTDSVTINNTKTTALNMGGGQALVVDGFETVNIVTTGAGAATTQTFGAITVAADTGGSSAVNFSGGNSVSAAIITAQSVSASGLTGTKALTMTAAMVGKATGVNTLTGSAGADTLVGDADDTTNINGGAGNDTITGGSDFETIDGGDGNDTIVGGGGADTLNGGAGNDRITLGSTTASANGGDGDDTVTASTNLTFGTTVIGGEGKDTLSVSFATAVSAANGSVVSGFETLAVAATGNDVALANFGNNTFSTVTVGALAATTITGVGSQTIQVTDVMTGDLTVTKTSTSGTADTLAINFASDDGVTAIEDVIAAGVEIINLSLTDTDTDTPDVNTVLLTVAAATTLNVTGDQGVTFAGSGNLTKVVTLDASGLVLAAVTATGVTYGASNSTVGGVTTITGSNGVDDLAGNAITNDTISGGSGADFIRYSGGADTFTGGAGADTFDVNALSAGTTTSKLVITDLTKGDKIDVGSIDSAGGVTAGALGDKGSLGSAATFQNYLDNAAAGDGSATSLAKWFQFDGNTYLVIDNTAGAAFAATDAVIQINGLVDLKLSTFATSALTIV